MVVVDFAYFVGIHGLSTLIALYSSLYLPHNACRGDFIRRCVSKALSVKMVLWVWIHAKYNCFWMGEGEGVTVKLITCWDEEAFVYEFSTKCIVINCLFGLGGESASDSQ